MKLKILVFPIVLIFAVWISIGKIWPKVEEINTLQAEINSKKAVLQKYQTKKSNIAMLAKDLNNNPNYTDFVNKYLPIESNEEEFINWIDKAAAESKLGKLDIAFESAKELAPPTPAPTVGSLLNNEDGIAAAAVEQPAPPVELVPSRGIVKIKVVGKYDQVYQFINLLHHTKRLAKLEEFTIKHEEAAEDTVEAKETKEKVSEDLNAELVLNFDYAKPLKLAGNYDLDMFDKTAFVYGDLDKVIASMNAFKLIDPYSTGRINPFLP